MNANSANPGENAGSSEKSRLCYVIMPFSGTKSCSEDQWTRIFEDLIKPAVEGAGLGYECRRSEATRGNIIKAIVRSLYEAHVVIADLTDQNPNVFYELGVRHALQDRTILLAQSRKSVPFDLRPYATHVYNWKDGAAQEKFRTKLIHLLADVDAKPDRPDNPVSDFLTDPAHRRAVMPVEEAQTPIAPPVGDSVAPPPQRPAVMPVEEAERPLTPAEVATAQCLAGPQAEGLNASTLGLSVGRERDIVALRLIMRPTRRYFAATWPARLVELNAAHKGDQTVNKAEIHDYALPLITNFSQDIEKVEGFALSLVDAEWDRGVLDLLDLAGDWITYSEDLRSGGGYRAIQGSPALCAWRLLCLMGSKAISNASMSILKTVLRRPIESRELGGQLNTQPLAGRAGLFYPEALLGYADLGVRYLSELATRHEHIAGEFVGKTEYLENLAKFLVIAGLAVDVESPESEHPLYPGYRHLEGARQAIESLVEGLRRNPEFLQAVASVLDETPDEFRKAWPERARHQNSERLGIFDTGPRLPDAI